MAIPSGEGQEVMVGFSDENTYDTTEFDRYEPIACYEMLIIDVEQLALPQFPVVDHYQLTEHVFSKRLKDTLHALDINGIQFFEAEIHHEGKVYSDYYAMNAYHRIECMDRKQSEFEADYDEDIDHTTYDIDKLVLDQKVLDAIPEKHRLIFVLKEKAKFILYHEKVVAAIQALQPKPVGVNFVPLSAWWVGSAFDGD